MVFKKTIKKNKYPYQVLLVDILIFLLLIFVPLIFFTTTLFHNGSSWNEASSIAIYLTCFIFILCAFGFTIFIDHKYNHLEFKKIFVILAIIISLINIIAVSALPNEVYLPYVPEPMIISPILRIRGITYGLLIAILPFLYFYLLPRKINSKSFLKLLLNIALIIAGIFIIISFFTDFNNYIFTIKNHFSDTSHPVTSIFVHKNFFASVLFCGLIVTLWLHILTKNWKYLLALIPIIVIEIFTFAKMPIFVSVLLLLAYFIYLIVRNALKSKDNLVITSLIAIFILFIAGLLITFVVNSKSGILFSIKNAINSIVEDAKSTFSSRTIIWEDTFKLLTPIQYIFGFSFALVGNAIQSTYAFDPRCPEDPSNIFHAHNTVVETIAEGGIIYLLINLFLFGYLIYIACKFKKKNPSITFMGILLIVLLLILGLTDPVFFLGENFNVPFAIATVVPILSLYYIDIDKKEISNHKEIVKSSNDIRKDNSKNCLLRLNKKLIILEAKYIAIELNKNIKF